MEIFRLIQGLKSIEASCLMLPLIAKIRFMLTTDFGAHLICFAHQS